MTTQNEPKLSALLSQINAANARLVRIESRITKALIHMGIDPNKENTNERNSTGV